MASENRVAKATTEALVQRANHFPTNGLSMAFERAKYLTRRGKKGPYENIQQYPYVPKLAPQDSKGEKNE